MFPTVFAAGLAILLAGPALAQDPQGEGAQAQPREPEVVLAATHGDWEVRCIEGTQNCMMVQTVTNGAGEPLIRVEVQKLGGDQQADAVMRFRTPEGVLLQSGLGLRVDAGEAVAAPFLTCVRGQCIAQASLRNQEVAMFKRGAAAELSVVPANAPNQPVTGTMSLMGFTRSFDSLQ